MTTTTTAASWALPWGEGGTTPAPDGFVLTIAWSLEEPGRVGEAAPIRGPTSLGRQEETGSAVFARERPTGTSGAGPLRDSRLSRRQLVLEPLPGDRLRVENVGKCPLLVNGVPTSKAAVVAGDTLTLKNVAVLFVAFRPAFAPLRSYPARLAFSFGAPDAHGIVGESPAIWRLRDALALAAASASHVVVHGKSGSGKELAARALHALSSRAERPFLARNAATFPEGLIDAELFGNVKNYPNPGMAERRGLIGDADGGTVFLDEIGELPAALQAHLLRVLDAGGEYQRLGESRPLRSDLRVVAATNRALSELKHDFLARFPVRIETPELEGRREDIPLLMRHLLALRLDQSPDLGRFFERFARGPAEARVDPALVDALLRQRYTHELRDLDRLLWLALSTSPGPFLTLSPEVTAALHPVAPAESTTDGVDLDAATITRALEIAGGSVTAAARALGLKNRFALYRLMKRYGIATADDDPES